MKPVKRILALILSFVFILSIAPITSQAAGVSYPTIKTSFPNGSNKTFKKGSVRDGIAYTMTLTDDTVFTFTKPDVYSGISFYKDKKFKTKLFGFSLPKGKEKTVAIAKGTYYVLFSQDVKMTTAKKLATKYNNKENYCKLKKVKLTKNKAVTIAQTPGYNYSRWYTLTTTAEQVLHLSISDTRLRYTVFDSQMKRVSFYTSGKTKISSQELPKGTYYLKINEDIGDTNGFYKENPLVTIKWY